MDISDDQINFHAEHLKNGILNSNDPVFRSMVLRLVARCPSNKVVMGEELKRKRRRFSNSRQNNPASNHKCQNCKESNAAHWHHIIPLSKGGTNSDVNIIPVCLNCHEFIHNCTFPKK